MRVGILLLADFQLTTFATLVDTLRGAERPLGCENCEITIMSPTGRAVMASCGLSLNIDNPPLWPEGFDYLVVIGDYRESLWSQANSIRRYIRTAVRVGVPIVGIGIGTVALARLGFLDGYRACTNAMDLDTMAVSFPEVLFTIDSLIELDRDRITSLGGVVASDLAAFLLEQQYSTKVARAAVRCIQRDRPRLPTAPQPSPYGLTRFPDPVVAQAIAIMESNICLPVPLEQIARATHLSLRQLNRRFQQITNRTARQMYLSIRLESAINLLLESRKSVTEIAQMTGFVDGAHFTRTLKREVNVTPGDVRSNA